MDITYRLQLIARYTTTYNTTLQLPTNTNLIYKNTYLLTYLLTLFIQTKRTSIYTTYNTNIILTFTLHCTAHTYTIYTSTNCNTYNTISNHLMNYSWLTFFFFAFVTMLPTLHYTKATNYGHRTTTTTTKKKSALKSNKVSNLLFVRPELVFLKK